MNKKFKVGITVGSFDLCHAGHMRMFKECKEVCDYLIVGLHNDPSLKEDESYRLKTRGSQKNKPIMSLEERKEILEAIKYIDEIFIYDTENDLYEKMKNLKYDVRFLGEDWKGKFPTGYEFAPNIMYTKRSHGFSTSELRERVYKEELKLRQKI